MVRPAEFLGEGADQTSVLTNTTGAYGRTWAVYLLGNADNMHYQFEASVAGSDPITLSAFATLYDPFYGYRQLWSRILEDTRPYFIDSYVTEEIPVYATVVNYYFLNPPCSSTTQCAMGLGRTPSVSVDFQVMIDGVQDSVTSIDTDGRGVATFQHTVQSGWNDINAYTYWDLRWISSVYGTGIDIEMARVLEDGSTAPLDDGGNVFFTDQGVQVTIDNILWRELELVIEEKPVIAGGDIVNPDSNKLPVLSSTLNSFFLPLAADTDGGEVELKLTGSGTLADASFSVTSIGSIRIYPTDDPCVSMGGTYGPYCNKIPNQHYSNQWFFSRIGWEFRMLPQDNFIIVAMDGFTPSLDYTVYPKENQTLPDNLVGRAYQSSSLKLDVDLVDGHSVFSGLSVLDNEDGTHWKIYAIDSNPVLDNTLIGQVLLINQNVYNSSRTSLENWVVEKNPALLKNRTILAIFLGRLDLVPDGYGAEYYDDDSISADDYRLGFKTGVDWDPDGNGTINKFVWNENSNFSTDIKNSDSFEDKWKDLIKQNCSTLKSDPPGYRRTLPFPLRDYFVFKWKEIEIDFIVSLKSVNISGNVIVTVDNQDPGKPDKVMLRDVLVDVTVDDLIDYNFWENIDWGPRAAARIQAGWLKYDHSPGGPGNIYEVSFPIEVFIDQPDEYDCD